MDIFGVTPVEIVLILILGLIVFGPERLPEIGRFLGRTLAKILAWQQQSPEAQLINQMRQDFDREIIKLRDEIIQARQQFDISSDVEKLRQDTGALLTTTDRKEPVVKAAKQAQPARAKTDAAAPSAATGATPSIRPEAAASSGAPETSINGASSSTGSDAPEGAHSSAAAAPPEPSQGSASSPNQVLEPAGTGATGIDVATLAQEIQSLRAEVQALQAQLYERGLLEPDRQPPARSLQEEVSSS